MARMVGIEPTTERLTAVCSAAELHAKNFYGKNGEIRTHGGLLALDGFQDRSIKPLCHISRIGYQFIWT